MQKMTRRVLCAFGLVFALATSSAGAQERMNVRGTVEKVDGQIMTVKSRDGATLMVKLADNVNVRGVVKVPLSEVKVGSFLAVSAMPQPDGSQRAISITLFPPQGFRPAEDFRPHDLQPGSTMTNAIVNSTATSVDGQVMIVKYKDQEKKIIVPPNTPIITYVPGDKSEIKPGTKSLSGDFRPDYRVFGA
jgi:hypothetical protein